MIRRFTLLVLGLVLALSLKAQDWRDELLAQNVGVIDSVVQVEDTKYALDTYSAYMIFYNQPLQHDAPEAGSISLRALLMVNNKNSDFYDSVIQMSIGGYEIDPGIINVPCIWADEYSCTFSSGEVAGKYRGHIIMPEHRFYGQSRPDNYKTLLSHCNAKEAADDFHALAEAMKKVFNGKWAITGTSKGGVATAIQHAYYPEDADLFVPYVGPILNGIGDLRPQEYWLTKAWTPEMREHAMNIQKGILNHPKVLEYYCKFKSMDITEGQKPENLYEFLYNTACVLDEPTHQEHDRSEVEKYFTDNQKFIESEGLTDYSDEMLGYIISGKNYIIGSEFKDYVEFYFRDDNNLTRSIIDGQADPHRDVIYTYQRITELGYFDLKWDYYYDTQAQADSVNSLWKSFIPHVVLYNAPEEFRSLEYDPSLMNFIKQQTAQAKKPILFIYGEDDPWTGACIDDEYVNGTNVRKYILPAQCHTASIYDIKDSDRALKDELNDFIRAALFPSPDGISEVNDEPTAAPAGIVFDQQNRRIVIRRNGQEYDVMGKKVF